MRTYINLKDSDFDYDKDLKRYFGNKDLVSVEYLIDSICELLNEREELKTEIARLGGDVEDCYKENVRIEEEEKRYAYECEQAEERELQNDNI